MATGQHQESAEKRGGEGDAKWAGVVGDRLAPMPRRRLKARDILYQSGADPGAILVRDYDSPNDMGFHPDAVVDLADGNVFRVERGCQCSHEIPCDAPPKLAFVANDRWEVTIVPRQTGTTLRGLFGLSERVELLRDHESPRDEPIGDDQVIEFADGPVFIARSSTITVKVNNRPVEFTKRKVTGLEFKQTAIAQKVPIDVGFVLYRVNPDGGLGASIDDSETVVLKECDEFRCVAPDDNSQVD